MSVQTYPAEGLFVSLQKETGIVPDYHPLEIRRHFEGLKAQN